MNKKTSPRHWANFAGFSDISYSSLLTLYCRAIETETDHPILQDDLAVEITRKLNPVLAATGDRKGMDLAQGKIKRILREHIALRSWYYDQMTTRFLEQHPQAVVVSMGCGLDTRFQRIKPAKGIFFDLDLPEVIQFKKKFISENDRFRMIARSVFDHGWMDEVKKAGERPRLFLAEGVFMYLAPEDVRLLVLELQRRFPGCELLCEVFNSIFLSDFWRPLVTGKLRRSGGLGESTEYRFGIRTSTELESWGEGIEFLDDWCYFDPNHPKLRRLRWFGKLELFRKVQWTVHYRLN